MTDTNDLPPLPDVWEWTGDSQSYRALTGGAVVSKVGGSICDYNSEAFRLTKTLILKD